MQNIILFFYLIWFCIETCIHLYMEKLITIKNELTINMLKHEASENGVSFKRHIENILDNQIKYPTQLCRELLEDGGQPYRAFYNYIQNTLGGLQELQPFPHDSLEILKFFKDMIEQLIHDHTKDEEDEEEK